MIKDYQEKINRTKTLFQKQVIKIENSCWKWRGSLVYKYGLISFNGRQIAAHRASYMIYHGLIPKGFIVCHTCDNPECTNPDHLFLGTQLGNIIDRDQKGRTAKGEKIYQSKLNEIQVIEIKKLIKDKVKVKEIALKYNVCTRTIHHIKNNKRWKHVKESNE